MRIQKHRDTGFCSGARRQRVAAVYDPEAVAAVYNHGCPN